MSLSDFLFKVLSLSIQFDLSVTSWIRSRRRNSLVGGVKDSYHQLGLAVDVVLDDKNLQPDFMLACHKLGLDCINEADHYHLEPR